ncbi:hypothetical protein AJ80_03309 [Polytolypa hystricis UAMH7299]|uniref:Fe2OG dioxygenase domain-containing protein n=1 Tax=Polytolypa hystricis (strain UAMH7299) TaxID=1447883 RepID=A0A2B7YKM2_POLH7|nr:hypothetical protein AJ80_03309 [Polytolypa hystricis UAMH7299]
MASDDLELPIIDLSGYLAPKSPGDKERVIAQVREASQKFGFFQVKGHGVSLGAQHGLIKGLGNLFSQPKEEKVKLSFLKNPCRRGYEASGDTLREGDALPDSKEAFYIGREDPVVEPPGFHGPNTWPDLPEEDFRQPITTYYEETSDLGRLIWELLLLGLGHSPTLMEGFTKRPIIMMKMIRYPPSNKTRPGQFGVGPHNDFGGVTVLLQQPEREGLEVWHEESQTWLQVPSIEDVFVINCGDMIQRWSGGEYKSAKHRVINKGNSERLSCATFWHGDFTATNPLNPNDPSKETVGQLLVKRFGNQFSLPKEVRTTA